MFRRSFLSWGTSLDDYVHMFASLRERNAKRVFELLGYIFRLHSSMVLADERDFERRERLYRGIVEEGNSYSHERHDRPLDLWPVL